MAFKTIGMTQSTSNLQACLIKANLFKRIPEHATSFS